MAIWVSALSETPCSTPGCDRTVPRGEPVCLVTAAKHPKCRQCALKDFGYTPPADLPALEAPGTPQVSAGSSQGWHRFHRSYAAKTTREAILANQRHDGRRKAAGE